MSDDDQPQGSTPKIDVDSVSGALAELDRDVHFFAAAINGDGNAVAGALVVEDEIDVELAGDFLVVNGGDDVTADGDLAHASFRDTIAAMNTGGSGRPAFRRSLHQQALLDGQIQRLAQPATDGQRFHAQCRR